MDLEHVLVELRMERDAIEAAIHSLERLVRSGNLGPDRLFNLAAKSPTNGASNGHGHPDPPGGG